MTNNLDTLQFKEKKQKMINTLNNHFGFYNVFSEVTNISDEDFMKIIELYEQKASVDGKNPWHYLYFDELIIMQQCLYEIIKDNYRYNDITAKLEILFEQELNRRLQRSVRSYGEETDETYRASYAEMPEYSTTLAEMCARKMQNEEKRYDQISSNQALRTYEEIKKDFVTAGIQLDESKFKKEESIEKKGLPRTPAVKNVYGAEMPRNYNMGQLSEAKKVLETLKTDDKKIVQREIELINLKQQINLIENERLEIEKRIKTITSETLGSYFSTQIEEKYPDEYSNYLQAKEQIRNHHNSSSSIDDIKERLAKVTEELGFYKSVIPSYESFYQRFEEMKTEREKVQASEKEQEKIYNLIYSEENERLRKNNSIYTAWDLGNKIIPQKYQGLSYEQVETMVNQEREQARLKQLAQETREDLINKAIRKDLGVAEDYHLSYIQIRNLRVEFDGYSDEELRDFVAGVKKQSQTTKIKQETTISYDEQRRTLINYIELKNKNFGKVVEIISVTGYPDSIYDVKFENGEIHSITITQDEKRNLSSNQISKNEETQEQSTNIATEEMQKKDLIENIMKSMGDAGEFSYIPLEDISQRIDAMKEVKTKLDSKSLEELEYILSVYSQQIDNIAVDERNHRRK